MKLESTLAVFALLAVATASGSHGRQVYRSLDGTLVATVISLPQRLYGIGPSRIEIRNRRGRLLAERDHRYLPNQGLTVEHAAWTTNSAFFVYSAEESGGHQPWHHPTFIYSRRKRHFYSLDEVLRCGISEPFELRAPETLTTETINPVKGFRGVQAKVGADPSGTRLTISLQLLERHLNASMISSDRKDRVDKKEQEKL